MNHSQKEKILLALLPFWTPLIPPIGLACLKSYLKKFGYAAKTVDASIEVDFQELYHRYFNLLKKEVPLYKQGNFYSIGHDVLRNHLMACLHAQSSEEVFNIVKMLIQRTFYVAIDDQAIRELMDIIDSFYQLLAEYLVRLLERETPEIFGLSVFSDTLPASIFAFRLVKEKFPGVTTVMGGGIFADLLAPASPNFEIFLDKTALFIDKIIIGEGEELFLKLLRRELPAGQRVFSLQDIQSQPLDLACLDVPDLGDFPIKNYPYLVSFTSRSCPFQCRFCSETVQWGKYRKKRPDQILAEIKKLYQQYHYQLFLFSDSLLNPIISELGEALIDFATPIYWEGWLRVDKKIGDLNQVLAWRRSGFYHARIGIESGSQRMLDLMDKRIQLPDIKNTLANLAYAGIKTTTLWVIGFPGETEEDFNLTLKLIEEFKNDIYEAECRPFYYYLKGQVNADDWFLHYKKYPLFPAEFQQALMFQTWVLDTEPSREITYDRMNRFVEHCRRLHIPNPYSLQEIHEADKRWRQLHVTAVPALLDFKNTDTLIRDTDSFKPLQLAQKQSIHDGQWGF